MESTSNYEFTFEQKKNLGPEEQSALIKSFKNDDVDGDGKMDEKEFKNILIDMGRRKITDAEVKSILDEYDQNKDGTLSWAEFVTMMGKIKGGQDNRFGQVTLDKNGRPVARLEGEHGGTHTYSIEERSTFSRIINYCCKDDEDLKDRLPMKADDDDLFHAFDNGILLCKLLMQVDKDCIDSRAINRGQINVY